MNPNSCATFRYCFKITRSKGNESIKSIEEGIATYRISRIGACQDSVEDIKNAIIRDVLQSYHTDGYALESVKCIYFTSVAPQQITIVK